MNQRDYILNRRLKKAVETTRDLDANKYASNVTKARNVYYDESREDPVIPLKVHWLYITHNSHLPEYAIGNIKADINLLNAADGPDCWQYYLWTNNLELAECKNEYGLICKNIFDLAHIDDYSPLIAFFMKQKYFSALSDMGRFLIMNEVGGIYCDVDYVFTSSPKYLHFIYNSYFGMERDEWQGSMASGFLAGEKEHPIFSFVIDLNRSFFTMPQLNYCVDKNMMPKEEELSCWAKTIAGGPEAITRAVHVMANDNSKQDLILGNFIFFGLDEL